MVEINGGGEPSKGFHGKAVYRNQETPPLFQLTIAIDVANGAQILPPTEKFVSFLVFPHVAHPASLHQGNRDIFFAFHIRG
jgi:hypothetical protein